MLKEHYGCSRLCERRALDSIHSEDVPIGCCHVVFFILESSTCHYLLECLVKLSWSASRSISRSAPIYSSVCESHNRVFIQYDLLLAEWPETEEPSILVLVVSDQRVRPIMMIMVCCAFVMVRSMPRALLVHHLVNEQ